MKASIQANGLCLDVPTYVQRNRKSSGWLKTLMGVATSRPRREFRSLLKDVSFNVGEGDRLALIGPNGAGKTTLLRLLTGAYIPTRGQLKMEGTRQALLNVGLGFSAEATLVENIYLRGTAMGIRGKPLRDMTWPVLEFASLEAKAQDRLSTLSAGQRARLGFAIATTMQRDIVLMDEWLGAGDAAFVQRANERMNDQVAGSKIMVLASHNTGIVKEMCNKGLVMDKGEVLFFGDVDSALKVYDALVKARKVAK